MTTKSTAKATQAAANQATLANWMRVQLTVRNGKDPHGYARAAARLTPWHEMQPAYASGALSIYAVDFIPEGWAYTDPHQHRIAFSRDTYFTLAHDAAALNAAVTALAEGIPAKNGDIAAGLRRVDWRADVAGAVSARREGDVSDLIYEEIDGEITIDRRPPDPRTDRVLQLEADYRALMARLRAAGDSGDARALGEGLTQVKALAERQQQLAQELARVASYAEVVAAMVKKLA